MQRVEDRASEAATPHAVLAVRHLPARIKDQLRYLGVTAGNR
jgi:hypothetical protein